MKRREFIAGLCTSAAWPLVAYAQQSGRPLIGFLSGRSPIESSSSNAAFKDALNAAGYVDGQNLAIEYRWAEGYPDRLPALAEDLVQRGVALIFAAGWRRARASGRSGHQHYSDRIHKRDRSRESRPCLQPQSARRQCHWSELDWVGVGGQASGTSASASA